MPFFEIRKVYQFNIQSLLISSWWLTWSNISNNLSSFLNDMSMPVSAVRIDNDGVIEDT